VRAAAIDAFRKGLIRVLTNVFVFTEGTDLPSAQVCLTARGASTAGTVLQMVGRVLRISPGKTHATWLDLQGISHVHGCPEDERLFRLEGKAITQAGALCKVCGAPIVNYPCGQCGYASDPSDGPEDAKTTITGDPLAQYERKIAESVEQRQQTLTRWMAAAAHANRAPGSVMHKWRAVYALPLPLPSYLSALRLSARDASPVVSSWARQHLSRLSQRRQAGR